jgi:hypothetical protein
VHSSVHVVDSVFCVQFSPCGGQSSSAQFSPCGGVPQHSSVHVVDSVFCAQFSPCGGQCSSAQFSFSCHYVPVNAICLFITL